MSSARPAHRGDTDEIVRLAEGMFAELNARAPGASWREAAREAVHDRVGDDLAAFVVDHPEHPGRLIALAAGIITRRLPTTRSPSGRVGYVQWVATDCDWRRRGFARVAITALLGWFDSKEVGMGRAAHQPRCP